MPENTPAAPIELAEGFNPFSDDNAPQVQPKIEEAPILTNEPISQEAPPPQEETKVEEQAASTQSFDSNQFIKERFGYDSVEQAEQEFKKLKEQPSFEFKDDVSRTLFDAIREGKADDVELLFYDQHFVPLKPEQGYDESDEDYAGKVKTWQSQVDYAERRLMIEAKVIRPELEKLKSEIKLPDIYNEAGREAESQEEFEIQQQARSIYEKTLDSDFQSFNGFNVSVKDEDVEIPISFNVGEDERLAMKNDLMDFDSDSYLENRWFFKDGKPNIPQIMADKYLLENREKIFSKIANEAASQRVLAHIKRNGNININQSPTPQGAKPDLNGTEAERLRMAEWAFSS